MAYQRILVALDRSSDSEVVLKEAMHLAQAKNARLMLFHCLLYESTVSPYTDIYGQQMANFSNAMQGALEDEMRSIRDWLTVQAQVVASSGITTEWDCQFGDAGSAICQKARSWQANLVVVGRRGRQGLSEILLGSISNHVVHHAPCSVLVVQGIYSEVEAV